MLGLLNAVAFGSALTAIFVFRFSVRRPTVVAAYFAFFAGLEWVAQTFFISVGAIPVELPLILFGIAVLFAVATIVANRLEHE